MLLALYIIIPIVLFCLLFFYLNAIANLKKRNQKLLDTRQDITYIQADDNIIIRRVNDEKIIPNFFEYIKCGGQEVIVDSGQVSFILSFYHSKGVPNVIKAGTKIKEKVVSFNIDMGETYMLKYTTIKGFYLDSSEKMTWITRLYKKFKQEFD